MKDIPKMHVCTNRKALIKFFSNRFKLKGESLEAPESYDGKLILFDENIPLGELSKAIAVGIPVYKTDSTKACVKKKTFSHVEWFRIEKI